MVRWKVLKYNKENFRIGEDKRHILRSKEFINDSLQVRIDLMKMKERLNEKGFIPYLQKIEEDLKVGYTIND